MSIDTNLGFVGIPPQPRPPTHPSTPETNTERLANHIFSYQEPKAALKPIECSFMDEFEEIRFFHLNSDQLIAGFLNLNEEKDGWKQGGVPVLAERFIRLSAIKLHKVLPPESKKVIHHVIHGLPYYISEITCSPTLTRVVQDVKVQGWKEHKVGRIVGNLGSIYCATNPFFEVIVNSHTNRPFSISIYANEEALNPRSTHLATLSESPGQIARKIYFSSSLTRTKEFLQQNENTLDPSSKRMIEGLCYLESREMRTQKAGNCWMKQPLRNTLAAIYLEQFSEDTELTPEKAWDKAMRLYKDLQLQSLNILEIVLNKKPNTDLKVIQAWDAFERRRQLLQK